MRKQKRGCCGGKHKGVIDVGMLLLLGLGVLFFASGGLKTISGLGFTTLSASPATLQSSDPVLNGEVWVLTVSAGGLGQSAVGAALPTQKITSTDGKESSEPIEVNINSQNNYCEYPIQQDSNAFPISSYGYKKYPITTSSPDVFADCSRLGIPVQWGNQFYASFDQYCVYKGLRGFIGNINDPHVFVSVDTSIQRGSEPAKHQTLSNKGQITAQYGDVAYSQWSGGLQTYDTCMPAPQASRMAVYDTYSTGWRITDSSKYSNYKTVAQANEKNKYSSEIDLQSAVNNWNNLADQAMGSVGFYSLKGYSADVPTGTANNGLVRMKIDDAIQIPIITFYIKTAWLAIKQPVPIPHITNVHFPDLATGAGTVGYITIQNNGDSGQINVFVDCGSLVSSVSGTVSKSVAKGTSETFTYSLTSGSVTTVTSTGCTAKAQALSNLDTYAFTVNTNPLKVCTPNERTCESNKVVSCNNEGSQKSVVEDCNVAGKQCGTNDLGYLTCVSKPSTCKTESQSVGIIDTCCSVATDGKTPLIVQNGICVRKEFPLFEAGLAVLVIGALAFMVMMRK